MALNLSLLCNMRCKRCYGHLDAFQKPYLMDFDTLRKCTELFLSQVPPRGGDIILLHDGSDRPGCRRTAGLRALPAILEGLRARGLSAVPVSELLTASGRPRSAM